MKVVGFGDNVVDYYVNKKTIYPGGNALNFAANAKKCGVEAAYYGVFGDDTEGKHIQFALKDLGVDISNCPVVKAGTTKKCSITLIDGERTFIGVDRGSNRPAPIVLDTNGLKYLEEFDLIHSSCNADLQEEIKKLENIPSIKTFDFSTKEKYRTDEYLNKICPYIDVALFSCEDMTTDEIKEFQKRITSFGTTYVLVTMGDNGQIFYDGNEYYAGRVDKVVPVDTMGAGDAFFTAFLMSMLKSGWKKENKLKKDQITNAFKAAAEYAAKNCGIYGAFGYGKVIE